MPDQKLMFIMCNPQIFVPDQKMIVSSVSVSFFGLAQKKLNQEVLELVEGQDRKCPDKDAKFSAISRNLFIKLM